MMRDKLKGFRANGYSAEDCRYRLMRELRFTEDEATRDDLLALDSELFEVWENADGSTGTDWRDDDRLP